MLDEPLKYRCKMCRHLWAAHINSRGRRKPCEGWTKIPCGCSHFWSDSRRFKHSTVALIVMIKETEWRSELPDVHT